MGLLGLLISANSAYADPAPITVRPSMAHPTTGSLGEPSIGVNFGYKYTQIQGDFRATFGSGGRTVTPDSKLGFTQSTTVGATSGNIQPSILDLINVDPSLLDKTGYNVYYVGNDGNLAALTTNLSNAIDQYAQLRNGNAEYIKELLLEKLKNANGMYDNMPSTDFGDYGLKDMFIRFDSYKLFFRPAYLGQFSGDGKVQTVIDQSPQRVMQYDANGNLIAEETDESYYAQPMKSYQTTSSTWPNISSVEDSTNGDVTYTATVYGSNGTAGKADLIANFDQNKGQLPNPNLQSLDGYWRRFMFSYYTNLVDTANLSFIQSMPNIDYTDADHQDVTYTIPASTIQKMVDPSRSDNTVTLYVTDMFGRYTSKTIPYTVQSQPNLKVTDIQYSPNPVNPGDTVNTSVLVTNQFSQPITTNLVTQVDGSNISQQPITVGANQSIRINGPSYTAKDQGSTLTFIVNPNHDQPNNEVTYDDNTASIQVPVQQQGKNLYIQLRNVPPSVNTNSRVQFEVAAGNESDVPITTNVTVRDDYKYSYEVCPKDEPCYWVVEDRQKTDTRSVTIPAHNEVTYPLDMPAGWDYFDTGINKYQLTLTGQINSDHSISETAYNDNVLTKKVFVNPLVPPDTKVHLYK
jgi:hypothetical protein